MGLFENDPRDTGYIALLVAITWYCEISSEAAILIAQGRSHRLPGQKLTPKILAEIRKITNSPNFYNINALVKKYRVNKYEILEALGGKNANEEVIKMSQADKLLKRLKDIAENCTAVDCEKCPLDKIVCGDNTLCETLSDTAVDGQGKLNIKRVRQMSDKCPTIDDLSGEVVKKTYRLYKQAADEIHTYIQRHPKEKTQDIVSLALLEYVERRKDA